MHRAPHTDHITLIGGTSLAKFIFAKTITLKNSSHLQSNLGSKQFFFAQFCYLRYINKFFFFATGITHFVGLVHWHCIQSKKKKKKRFFSIYFLPWEKNPQKKIQRELLFHILRYLNDCACKNIGAKYHILYL